MKKIKSLHVPVTQGLKDIYSMDMHLAYQTALIGQFTVEAFGRLAAAISVVLSALEQNQTKIPLAIETLNATVKTLLAVKKRGDETDVWEITASELPPVLDGILMAEECIGTLDVALLERTAAMLLQSVSGEQDSK
jgi:hypothetical protein